jgi:ferric-dicitrate binding protein FerR (iron transport regulator)
MEHTHADRSPLDAVAAPHPAPLSFECEDAVEWIHGRTLGETSASDQVARDHMRTCSNCRELYRQQIAIKARVGRAVMRAGVESGAFLGRDDPPRFAPRHRRLLVVIALSLAIAGVVRLGGGLRPDPTLGVQWIAGEFFVAGEPTDESYGPRMGLRGDLLQTGQDGRARVRLDDGQLLIGASTTLLVESAVARRVRMVGGRVTIDGKGKLMTPFGVVVVDDGAVEVSLIGDEYTLNVLEGSAQLVTALGAEEIHAGKAFDGRL